MDQDFVPDKIFKRSEQILDCQTMMLDELLETIESKHVMPGDFEGF